MRKIGIVVMALLAMSVMTVTAQAATTGGEDMKGQFSIGVDGGLAVPTGKLAAKFDADGADMKMGYDFGVFVDYFIMPQVALGAHFNYVTNNMKDQTIETEAGAVTFKDLIKAKTMVYGIHAKYMIPTGGKLLPYLGVGLSGYNRKLDLSSDFQTIQDVTESSISDNKFGADGMVGVDYKVAPELSIGVNGAYHYSFGKLEHDFGDGVKQEILKDWTFMTFNAAITYHMPMGTGAAK